MSPRNEEQNAMIKDERREQILMAALRVFARRGFAATKISDIVTQAGMSHGLIYHYFKSKEEIFYELLNIAHSASGESLLMVETMPISPLQKVRETAKYILGAIGQGEETSYFFLIVVHASMMEMTEEHKMRSNPMTPMDSLVRILKQGQQADEIRDGDPLEMATMFFAAIHGVAIYKLSMPNFKLPDPELLVQMVKK